MFLTALVVLLDWSSIGTGIILYFAEKHLIFLEKQCLTKMWESCSIDKDYA